jgi:uncharacterized protein
MHRLKLTLLPERFAICQLPPEAAIPAWANQGSFHSITRTADELSLITTDAGIPPDVTCDHDWRAFKIDGPLEFSLTGVLESVARPLADAAISIFAIATYNTDYVLVKSDQLTLAIAALRAAGHTLD